MLALALLLAASPPRLVPATASVTIGNVRNLHVESIYQFSTKMTWGPDGAMHSPPSFGLQQGSDPLERLIELRYSRVLNQWNPQIIFRIGSSPTRIDAGANTILHGFEPKAAKDDWFATCMWSVDRQVQKVNISVGLADGPWKQDARFALRKGQSSASRDGIRIDVIHPKGSASSYQWGIHFTLSRALSARSVQFHALDSKGREFEEGGSVVQNGLTYYFDGMPEDLATVTVTSCPYTWTTFQGVSLYPAAGRKRS